MWSWIGSETLGGRGSGSEGRRERGRERQGRKVRAEPGRWQRMSGASAARAAVELEWDLICKCKKIFIYIHI